MIKSVLFTTFVCCMTLVNTNAASVPEGPFINPQGITKEYTRSGEGIYTGYSGALLTKSRELLAAIVTENDEGDIFFSCPFVTITSDCCLKGVREGNRIRMDFPQVAYVIPTYNQEYSLYVMELADSNEGVPTYKVSSLQSVYMDQNEEGIYTLELPNYDPTQEYPQQILGLCKEDEEWIGFAEYQMTYTPFNEKKVTPPEELTTEEWSFVFNEMGYSKTGSFVNVGFDKDKIYIQGISKNFPEAWIEGNIDGSHVRFSSHQYIGALAYYCFFSGGKLEMVYNPDWDEYYLSGVETEDITLELDIAQKKLSAFDDDCMLVTTDQKDSYPIEEMWYINFAKQSLNINLTPQTPDNIDYYLESDLTSTFSFDIPVFNVDNELLHTNNLYYIIYVDDEPMTFYTDEYPGLEDELVLVPFNLTCGYDIQAYGSYHSVTLFAQGMSTVGVQAVYISDDGSHHASAIITYDIETEEITSGTNEIVVNQEIDSVKYYDLKGNEVKNPAQGFYIKKMMHSDGTFSTEKMFMRDR